MSIILPSIEESAKRISNEWSKKGVTYNPTSKHLSCYASNADYGKFLRKYLRLIASLNENAKVVECVTNKGYTCLDYIVIDLTEKDFEDIIEGISPRYEHQKSTYKKSNQ